MGLVPTGLIFTEPAPRTFSGNVRLCVYMFISGFIRPPKSQSGSIKYEKHQFALINHNIFMKAKKSTCFMTKSLSKKIWWTVLDFCVFFRFA